MSQPSDNFNRQAAEYDKQAHIQKNAAQWAATFLEMDLQGKTAHEFGAGTGFLTHHLIRTGACVKATDRAESMVRIGAQKYPEARWQPMDAWKPPPFPEVDRIYSASLLQWASQPLQTLKRWKGKIKKGGSCLHAIYIEGTLSELFKCLPCPPPITFKSDQDWEALFREAGYSQVKTSIKSEKYEFASPLALLRSLHKIGVNGSIMLGFTETKRLLARYRSDYSLDDGKIYSTWTTCIVEASVD
jgi:SAM-dependent methyltransferase